MKHRKRIYYTDSQKSLMWDRWRQGESLHQIAALFDRHHSSVHGVLVESGGIRPPQRRRSARVLSLGEREEISRGMAVGRSVRLPLRWGERLPQSVENLNATKAAKTTEPVRVIRLPGIPPYGSIFIAS